MACLATEYGRESAVRCAICSAVDCLHARSSDSARSEFSLAPPDDECRWRAQLYSARQSQEATSTAGTFYLSVSNDGGANWRQVGLPIQASKLQNWSVGPSGEVYAAMYLIPATTTAFTPTAIATPAPSIYRYDPTIN